jgi:hypothetical protein
MFRGRHEHRRLGELAATHTGVPVAHTRPMAEWPTPAAAADPGARHRAAGSSPLRNGLTAAAVVGGTLALAVPTMAISGQADQNEGAVDPATLLHLSAADAAGQAQPVVLHTAGVPAVEHSAILPPELEVAGLVKAAGLAEAAERARQRAGREAAARCDADLDGLGKVKPWARNAARFLSCLYDEPQLGGVAGRGGRSDHPSGLAVDFMVSRARGDRIAACALANQKELGVEYVLWRQRANYGDGWERMSDRGGDTANHQDHVHISFAHDAPDGDPRATRCK